VRPLVTLRKALNDPALLGGVLLGPTRDVWEAILLASMGELLTEPELKLFSEVTGRERAPDKRVDELWAIVGRRGGKSRAMAVLALYLAGFIDYSDRLVRGERGTVLLIAPDMKLAKVSLEYAYGAAQTTPMLSQLIAERRADELVLNNGIVLEVQIVKLPTHPWCDVRCGNHGRDRVLEIRGQRKRRHGNPSRTPTSVSDDAWVIDCGEQPPR
jgi:hypothetical protein